MLRFGELERRASELAEEFRSRAPFPHVVFDDLLEKGSLEVLRRAFPEPAWRGWVCGDREHQRYKYSCQDVLALPESFSRLLGELSSGAFVHWLEEVTGIDHLLVDPDLAGGGLHLTLEGGWLTPHIDFHVGRNPDLYRRINLILYLNEGWREENGGQLELWDARTDAVVRRVPPELGTAVIFRTDASSLHGFSSPVAGRTRCSVALDRKQCHV